MEQQLQAEVQNPGHYKLVRKLGEGGFGDVYLAWDARLERQVAIKRLKAQLLASRPGQLLDEARMAASLRHPAFVRIFSIDGDAEQPSIVMEFVEGSTLRQLAAGQPMPEMQVRDIVRQVAGAMAEAHAANLIHGDLKPSNLMLEASGAVRILDFGLASRVDPDATQSSSFDQTEGTVAYLAPELLLGSRQNAQSDIYALGVVMYELLTGARPFAHLSGLALAAAHIQSSSELWMFPAAISAETAALVRAMTARDLTQRLPSMQAVGMAIGSPGAASAPSPRSKFRLRSLIPISVWARSTLIAAVAVVLVMGALQTSVGSAWLQRNTPFFSEAAAMQAGLVALKAYDRAESIDVAIEHFKAILARRPGHAAAAAGLSLAYSMRHVGDSRDESWLQRADASAQLALKLDDQLAMAYTALAAVRLEQGKEKEALPLIERALSLNPLDVSAIDFKAGILIYLNRFDEASAILVSAIKRYPHERKLEDSLGVLRFKQSNYKDAELAFRRSIAIEPDATLAYASLSAALLRQNRAEEALQVLQQGLQIRPSGTLYTTLGNVLFNRADYVGAAQAFENAVSASKGNSNTYLRWANLADTLRWIPGREDASRRAYNAAVVLMKPLLERTPGDVTMTSRLGLYSARLGDASAARALTERAVKTAPENPDVRFRAAMAYELIGSRENALAELRGAQERGYPQNLISAEPDLIALRRDPRFHQPTMESVK
ncbi:MAG: protein kinase [Pseudomonadota bacterium]